jgi:predicted TIM-barrel fold metal-dependent hydrolase
MLELEHGFRVLDCHVEFEPDPDRRSNTLGDPQRIEREFTQAGIVVGLAFPAERDGSYLEANNALARVAVERPLVAAARISGAHDPPTGPQTRLRNATRSRTPEHTSPSDVEEYGYADRFAAFALDPRVDGLPDESVLETLADVGLPVVTYGGREFPPDLIERTLLEYSFPLVVAHCGGYPLDESLTADTIDLLEYHDCYVDTSAVRFRDPLERVVMEHPDRVLFGSGAPAVHPNVAIMEILTLDVPEDAMQRVFSSNAERIIPELGP